MNWKKIVVALAVMPLFFGCIKDDDNKETGESLIVVGDKIPSFKVTGNQKTFDSSELDAQVTLITLFHPGCGDCKRAFPHLLYVWEQFKEDDRFEMVNIGREQTLENIPDTWKVMPCYPDPNRSIYDQFATATIPRIYIVSETGIVEEMWVEYLRDDQGEFISEADFAKIIEGYLRMR